MCTPKVISEKKMDLDDILGKFGIFQSYHLQMMILTFFAFVTNALYSANFVFVAEEVNYRCKDDLESSQSCSANSTQVCSEWLYDDPDSFVAYFQLACHEWKRTLVGTVHSFGYMCGLLLVGPMSDRLGRKTAVIITGILGGFFGIVRSFSMWYWFYIAMEFLEAAIGDCCSPMYVLTIEIVSTKKRLVFYMMCGFGYCFGGMALSLFAWLTPNWRWFLRAIYLPTFLFFTYIYLLDESPRWLLTKGRKEKAVAILEKAAKKNNIVLEKDVLEKLSCEVSPDVPYKQLLKDTFKSSKLRRRFFVCLVWWTASTFVNYGMIINSVSLQGNKYLNFALVASVEIPANIIVTYILINFKRKLPLMFSFFIGAVLCLALPFIPVDLPWISISFFMAGKLMSSFFFAITYMYTSELFPTYTRNSMHALCSSLGRIGSIIAPQTPLLITYWSGLPSLVFGTVSFLAGLTTFLVPDVSDDLLPDTVVQAEALGKSKIPSKALENYNEGDISQL
ncbi:organic cation transporter protein-like isoform X2 [Nymphalis io]|uniref:organic cation transporter protein-like isoform X2 n=1 Tax=Inachis io TaxID=171585 RepID=UPI002167AC8A|nr:organic cation transporter protein-like isoform X2 [Nymphalis io]